MVRTKVTHGMDGRMEVDREGKEVKRISKKGISYVVKC